MRSNSILEKILRYSAGSLLSLAGCGPFSPDDLVSYTPLEPKCNQSIFENTILTGDLTNCEDGLRIITSDIVLDCDGYTIDGSKSTENSPESYGISMTNVTEVAILNCNIKEFHTGIYIRESDDNMVSNSKISDNNFNGIYVSKGLRNQIGYNTIDKNETGILLELSDDNEIYKNSIKDNSAAGVFVLFSNKNTVEQNEVELNSEGILVFDSSFNYIYENSLFNNQIGIHGGHAYNNTFVLNSSTSYSSGIVLENSFENVLFNNGATNNDLAGIRLFQSANNTISDALLIDNKTGIQMYESHNNTVKDVLLAGNGIGIEMINSQHNTLYNNLFDRNGTNALEDEISIDNIWNTHIGNFWDDFSSNFGFPDFYEIEGPGTGADNDPQALP
jgi:parallel beta-helix repeat protein